MVGSIVGCMWCSVGVIGVEGNWNGPALCFVCLGAEEPNADSGARFAGRGVAVAEDVAATGSSNIGNDSTRVDYTRTRPEKTSARRTCVWLMVEQIVHGARISQASWHSEHG